MCRKLKKKSVMKTSDKTSMAINGYANSGNIVRYVWPYAALLIICLVLVVFFWRIRRQGSIPLHILMAVLSLDKWRKSRSFDHSLTMDKEKSDWCMETGQLKKIIERTVHKYWTGTIEDRNIDCWLYEFDV